MHLRVARQCENALALARHFEGHPKVARVLYPGLPSHPGHEVARRQMSAFGGIVSLVLAGGLPAAERFYDGLRLISRAASLGGVESLVSLPVHTSHYGYTDEQLAAAGIDPGRCASRSGSRTRPTSSKTSTGRWPVSNSRGAGTWRRAPTRRS